MSDTTLLPDNRMAFEEAVDLTCADALDLRDGLRNLVKPYDIPSSHLPWLAWGLSVDLWKRDWPEAKKRSQTARALPFHAIKGTQTAISEALKVMGAAPRRFVVPPAKTYVAKSLTDEERAAYLDRFAQLRVYPFVARGITGRYGLFLSCGRGLGTTGLGPVNPVSLEGTRYLRTAKLYDQGQETKLTIRVVTPESLGRFAAFAYDEVIIGPKPTAAIHLGAPPKAQSFLVDDFGVRQRVVRIPRETNYTYRLGREQYTTVWPQGQLIDVQPQYVAEVHDKQETAVHPGAPGARLLGACLPPSIAWRHIYERWHIHDPDRVPDQRKRSTHLGITRLGMPAYTAEVLTRLKGRRHPRTVGRFVNGFLVAANRRPIENARSATMAAKSLRDKVLINTKTYRLPKVGDRRPIGRVRLGEYIEV